MIKIECDRSELAAALQMAGHVVKKHGPRPALSCFHLAAEQDVLLVTGTDMSTTIRAKCAPTKMSGGTALLPIRALAILKGSSAETVKINATEKAVKLRVGRSQFTMPSISVDEWPAAMPAFPKKALAVSGPAFSEAVQRVVFAVATDAGRYAIQGASLKVVSAKMELAATDGRRLAIASCECGNTKIEPCIVDPQALVQMSRLGDQIKLSQTDSVLRASGDRGEVASVLIDGTFPDYKSMTPDLGREFQCDAGALAEALGLADAMLDDMSRSVTFHVTETEIRLTTKAASAGESDIALEAKGQLMEFTVQSRYALDGLRHVGEIAVLDCKGGDLPSVVFRTDGYVYVIAQVRHRE